MSLLRLLAAGKSLVGAREPGARYQLSSHRPLPKFEAKKNPFRGAASAMRVVKQGEEESQTLETGVAASEPESKIEAGESHSAERLQAEDDVQNLFKRIAGLFKRRSPPRQTRSASRASRDLVQAELSLDSVKVMRNDLSDSDFEIVTAGSGARPAEPSGRSGSPASGPKTERDGEIPAAGEKATDATRQPGAKLKSTATSLVGRLFGAGQA